MEEGHYSRLVARYGRGGITMVEGELLYNGHSYHGVCHINTMVVSMVVVECDVIL